jgi:hypothetical protein
MTVGLLLESKSVGVSGFMEFVDGPRTLHDVSVDATAPGTTPDGHGSL